MQLGSMQFIVMFVSLLLVSSVTVLVAGSKTVLETAVSMTECLEDIDNYTCTTDHGQGIVDIALQCGPDHFPVAETHAAQCSSRDDGAPCFGTFSNLNITRVQHCSSLEIGHHIDSCTPACRDFLQDTLEDGGCCVDTVFNTRFSLLVLGYDIQVAYNVCDIALPSACISSLKVDTPDDAEECTFSEFWHRLVEYLCTVSVGQPYVDAIIKTDRACTPIASHYASYCGSVNGRYCLDILQGSFPLVNPTQNAYVNPYLKNVTSACANYSSFTVSGTCPAACKSALEIALDEFGCCINMFNNTVNEVLLPHISDRVMIACDLDSPGQCTSILSIGSDGSITTAALIWICLGLLSVLVSQL